MRTLIYLSKLGSEFAILVLFVLHALARFFKSELIEPALENPWMALGWGGTPFLLVGAFVVYDQLKKRRTEST